MQAILVFFQNILASNYYIPHGHCYLWQTPLMGLHLISDGLIAIAYFSIPAMLIYFVSQRRDLPLSKVFVLFGAFTILSGMGHLLDIWTVWHPDYWISGIEHALTALVSCYTVLQLVGLLPEFLALQTPEQLAAINQELEKQVVERQHTEETLHMIMAGTASVTGKDYFPALLQNLAIALDVAYAIVFEKVDDSLQRLRSINFWSVDHLVENFEYELINTPEQDEVDQNLLSFYTSELQQSFPHSALISQLKAESYMGFPLVDINQNVIGNLCILDVKPLKVDKRTKVLLSVFAARASAELQRKWAEDEKRQAYEELELRVVERTAELVRANNFLESEISEKIAAEAAMRMMAEREQTTTNIILKMRQTLDLESIFDVTTTELRQIIKCDRVLIYRFQPDWSGELVSESVAANWNTLLPNRKNDPELTQIAVNQPNLTDQPRNADVLIRDTYLQSNCGGILQKNSYCFVNDIKTARFDPCYLNLLEKLQAQAYIITPIFCGQKLWGLLGTYQNSNSRNWQQTEFGIVSQIGNQLGIAVQQAELLTQTQKQSEALKRSKEAADAASRAKSEFLANMSHELRTPLNAILGFTQLMQQDQTLNFEHQQYIQIINQSGEHLLALINDVLEMSKIEAGRISLSETEFDLHQMLVSLTSMLQLKSISKGLQLSVDCDISVPQYIKTDENKLRQVLINLLDNAIKFTKQGSVSLRISSQELSAEEKEEGEKEIILLFAVEDTGPGIASEEISDLFQAFQQTQVGQQSKEGTGLGLAISQKFVQLMGGEINVSSKLGQGSCFQFHIQVALAEEFASSNLRSLHNVVSIIAPEQTTYRILIVEDYFTNRLLLSQFLLKLGFEVQEAENGQDAIAIWQQWQPHLIFMDLMMPIVNGYEATRRIRQLAQELATEQSSSPTKIIALTASTFAEQRQESFNAGCDDFLSKPFRQEEILEILSQHLSLQYLYESTPVKTISKSLLFKHNSVLEKSDLAIMPTEWLEELHLATTEGDDIKCFALIAQIPSEHTSLIAALTKLIETYQFDLLMILTQPTSPDT